MDTRGRSENRCVVTLQDRARPLPVSLQGLRSDQFVTPLGLRGVLYCRADAAGLPDRTAVAIGQFDGVHRGHQALLSRTRRAGPPDAAVGAVTFDQHPMSLLDPDREPPILTRLEDKVCLLLTCRLDFVAVLRLEPALLGTGPVEFVNDLLVSTLKAAAVAVGPNFRFGRAAAGDPALLQQLGPASGFVAAVPELARYGGAVVSSTAIRTAIVNGDVADAARLLGRPHWLQGFAVEVTLDCCRIAIPRNVAAPSTGRFVGELRVPVGLGRPLQAEVQVDVHGSRLDVRGHDDELLPLSPGDKVSLALARRLDAGADAVVGMEEQ
ncbi:hypothetical protein ABZ468_38540 [Streptomyces sp. NPDC005708]|uniref:hypothetical protein n=1 Tax=Streptomyces sp. NPDC005708 TaxID=3154564 RepID=UPI0033CAB32A